MDRDEGSRTSGANRSRQQGAGRADEGFGDDQGTRVGRPDPERNEASPSTGTGTPSAVEGSILEGEESRRGMTANDRANTGAGAEGAEGIHSAKSGGEHERSGVERAHGEPGRGEGAGLSGSEPLRHRETEHKSGYGGEGAGPKESSE
jgi:hypothetical protein